MPISFWKMMHKALPGGGSEFSCFHNTEFIHEAQVQQIGQVVAEACSMPAAIRRC